MTAMSDDCCTWRGTDPDALAALETIDLRAADLPALVCLHGGGAPPGAGPELAALLRRIVAEPETPLRLVSAFDCNGGPRQFPPEEGADRRRMDLAVLRRLQLVPGDVRRARELLRRMKETMPDLDGICVFSSPTERWPSWPPEAVEAYVRGLQSPLPPRQSPPVMAQVKERSVAELDGMDRLYLRPHHLMCLMCFHGGGSDAPLAEDNLFEVMESIVRQPDIAVTLVEGCCMICPPCHSFDPPSGTCVAACGLRDRLKDLEVLRLCDLLPGDTLPARELLRCLAECIPHPEAICGGAADAVAEWQACGSVTSGRYERGLERLPGGGGKPLF